MQFRTGRLTDVGCFEALPASRCGLLMATIRSACSSVTKYSNNCNRFSTDDKRWEIGPSARHVYGHPDQPANSLCTMVNAVHHTASMGSIKQHNHIKVHWKNAKKLSCYRQIFHTLKCSRQQRITHQTRAEIHWAPFQTSQHHHDLIIHIKLTK